MILLHIMFSKLSLLNEEKLYYVRAIPFITILLFSFLVSSEVRLVSSDVVDADAVGPNRLRRGNDPVFVTVLVVRNPLDRRMDSHLQDGFVPATLSQSEVQLVLLKLAYLRFVGLRVVPSDARIRRAVYALPVPKRRRKRMFISWTVLRKSLAPLDIKPEANNAANVLTSRPVVGDLPFAFASISSEPFVLTGVLPDDLKA